jgi:hypothetical protein
MEKSESIKEIAQAIGKFQSEIETIKKTETNPVFTSKYASLSNILDAIKKPLAANGLSFVQFPTGNNGLATLLMHESGEWILDSYTMTPFKNDPQGIGSAITYQRRYALGSILGLNIDIDDDGNSASGKIAPTEKPILVPKSLEWGKAIEFLVKNGKIEDVEKKYTLTKENKEALLLATSLNK